MALSPTALCRLDQLADPGSVAATLDDGTRVLVVRRGNEVFAYVNYCPHAGHPLDWVPGQFLDFDKKFILCASHGASFVIETGMCVGGPCAGKSLSSIPITLENGSVWAVVP